MSVSQPEVEGGSATDSAGSLATMTGGNAEEEGGGGGYSAGVEVVAAAAQSTDTDATDSETTLHPLVSSILSSQKVGALVNLANARVWLYVNSLRKLLNLIQFPFFRRTNEW